MIKTAISNHLMKTDKNHKRRSKFARSSQIEVRNRFATRRTNDGKISNALEMELTIDTKFYAINLPYTHTFSSVPRHFSMLRAPLERRLSDENAASIVRVRDSTDNHLVMHLARECIHIYARIRTHGAAYQSETDNKRCVAMMVL